jgi:hypothetical protein
VASEPLETRKEINVRDASKCGTEGFVGTAVGELATSLRFWEDTIEADDYALSIIRQGYRIQVDSAVSDDVYREKNNKSAVTENAFAVKETLKLLDSGQVVECDGPVQCTNPLTVASKRLPDGTNKLRLCMDFSRFVNPNINSDRYKMATLQHALEDANEGDFASVFDVRAAYHHIRLAPESYRFVGFALVIDGKERYFYYTVLVFGLKVAAQVLGRVFKPLLQYLARHGVRCVLYIDDGRPTGSNKHEADKAYAFTLDTMESAGFVIAIEKSFARDSSTQDAAFLGVIIDTRLMEVRVPAAKLAHIKDALTELLARDRFTVRELSSVIGRLISVEVAFGPRIYVATRMATNQVTAESETRGWCHNISLSADTADALATVLQEIDAWNGYPIRNSARSITLAALLPGDGEKHLERKIPRRPFHDVRLYMASDASDTVVAAFGVGGLPGYELVYTMTSDERALSSSRRELLAIEKALYVDNKLRQHRMATLFWLCDNQNVAKFLTKGSGNAEIMRTVMRILGRARTLLLDVFPIWVPREDGRIQRADALTKGVDSDEWSIHRADFDDIRLGYGRFTVDLFATSRNSKCDRFYSADYDPASDGTDAFSRSWNGEVAFAALPIALIARTVRKLAHSEVRGVLTIPLWRGARFWAAAFRDGRHANRMFKYMEVREMRTFAWRRTERDQIGGKSMRFMILHFATTGEEATEDQVSQVGRSRCVRRLFGQDCFC